MENILITISFALIGLTNTIYGYSSHEPARACGDHLADVLALVCKDRGYNFYFSPDDTYVTERRYKRGIVEECCHSGCSYHTLEQYCKPITTETPDNSQIRKRSDNNNKGWQLHPDIKTSDTISITKNLFSNFHHRYNLKKPQQQNEDKNLQEYLMESSNNNSNEQSDETITFNKEKDLLSNLTFSRNIQEQQQQQSPEETETKIVQNKNEYADLNKNHNDNNNNYDVNSSLRNLLMILRIKNSIENLKNKELEIKRPIDQEDDNNTSSKIINNNSNEKDLKLNNNNDRNEKNKLISLEEFIKSGEFNSFIDRRHRKLPEYVDREKNILDYVDKIRHNGESHHKNSNMTNRRNYHSQREDSQQKQHHQDNNSRSVFSRVGIVNPYFMEKELVHPNVRPSVNFTVNLRQHTPLRKR